MKLKFIIYIVLATIVVGAGFFENTVEANSHGEKQIEEFVKGNNYLPLREAIALFEKKVNKKVILPTLLPFEPTHRFGKITDNGDLQVHYMNVSNHNHEDFIFYVMFPETEIDKHLTKEDKVITLANGDKAFFRVNSIHLHTLAFKKNGWGYLIGGNPKQNTKYNVEGLIEIANSVQ